MKTAQVYPHTHTLLPVIAQPYCTVVNSIYLAALSVIIAVG